MKKTKIILTSLLLTLSVLTVVLMPALVAILTPPVYESTFVGALDEKVERLASIEEDKVVVIGGSSVAFGLDSALMEEHLGMPVVNFGLYAAIGTKAMLDLALPHIKEGDIVILAPETDAQTLSLYFSGKNMWQAIDGDLSLFFSLKGENQKEMLGALYGYATDKISVLRSDPLDPEGIYNSKNFNKHGDVIPGLRAQNVMPLYYDANTVISPRPEIVEDAFVDYVNSFSKECASRGAKVYYSYAPMNRAALASDVTEESLASFSKYLESKILCDAHISRIGDYVIDEAYFFDTNYHLNDAGVRLRTKMLIEDIRFENGDYQAVNIELLPKPALPEIGSKFFGTDENDKYFVYKPLKNGMLSIVGLTELGRAQTELTVPLGADQTKVVHIARGAFEGGSARKVTIPEQSNVRLLETGLFLGSDVKELYILYDFEDEAEKLSPPTTFGDVRVYVPQGSELLTHYDWEKIDLIALP